MRINIAGQTYHVGFRIKVLCCIRPESKQHYSRSEGESICRPPDVFDEALGKKQAFARALAALGSGYYTSHGEELKRVLASKNGRAEVWEQYLAKSGEPLSKPSVPWTELYEMHAKAKQLHRQVTRQLRHALWPKGKQHITEAEVAEALPVPEKS